MAGFCTNCGAPLTGAFCSACGTRVGASSSSVSIPAQPVEAQPTVPLGVPPATTAARSSGLGKVLLIVGGILLVLFVIGAATAIYGFYWVKHRVADYSSVVTGESSGPVSMVARGKSCRLLSTAQLQKVLGVTIEKSAEIMEGSEPGCAYYTNAAAFAELQRTAVELARRQSQEAANTQSLKTDNPLELLKNTNQMEGIVKSFGLSQPDKDGKIFTFHLNHNYGRHNWTALRATMSVVPGFEDLPGVGDRAMMGSMGHVVYVLKGDTVVTLELMYVPDARTRGVELGRDILSHM
jgi:hypothetical protein